MADINPSPPMKEDSITSDLIYVISRHSNWRAKGIQKAFVKAGIYPQQEGWKKFIEIAILTLGIAFTVCGIIFFFAFNWQYLHRFVKLGIVEGLIVITILTAVFSKLRPLVKDVLLTGASLLVGCLFAVFGQIYQTGANAYDFFLGWTVFVAGWCIAASFAPLWLLFLGLVNITVGLYADQVASDWPDGMVITLLFGINAIAVILAETIPRNKTILQTWFIRIGTLAAVGCSTIGICEGIFDHGDKWLVINLLLAIVLYALAIWRSLQVKHVFYMTLIPLSVIIMISALIMRVAENEFIGGLLMTAIFIAACITLLIRQIIKINKSWHGQPLTDR